jgi:methionyl-tRNA synthetase
MVSYDEFSKIELKVGIVKIAELVPNSEKLLRLELDVGEEKPRQLVAGIAQHYKPEELIGKSIIVVANLDIRTIRGLESQGMLLAADLESEGRVALLTTDSNVPAGTRIK